MKIEIVLSSFILIVTATTNLTVLLILDNVQYNQYKLWDTFSKQLEPMDARLGVLTLGESCPMTNRQIQPISQGGSYDYSDYNSNPQGTDNACTLDDVSIFSYEPAVRQTPYSLVCVFSNSTSWKLDQYYQTFPNVLFIGLNLNQNDNFITNGLESFMDILVFNYLAEYTAFLQSTKIEGIITRVRHAILVKKGKNECSLAPPTFEIMIFSRARGQITYRCSLANPNYNKFKI